MPDIQTPTFSIIITCYNYGNYLKNAIDSVLAQNYPRVEIIVIDDASTDETPQVAAHYGNAIRYFRSNMNLGAAGAWAYGLSLATGAYLCKLDADDWQLPGFLDTVSAAFEADPTLGFVATSVIINSQLQNEIELLVHQDQTLDSEVFRHRLLRKFFFRMPGTAIRREVSLNALPPLKELYQIHDWEFFLRALKGWKARLITKPLAVYRLHTRSITATARSFGRLENDLLTFLNLAATPGSYQVPDHERRVLASSMVNLLIQSTTLPLSPKKIARYYRTCKAALPIAEYTGFPSVRYVLLVSLSDTWRRILRLAQRVRCSFRFLSSSKVENKV